MLVYRREGLAFNSSSSQAVVVFKSDYKRDLALRKGGPFDFSTGQEMRRAMAYSIVSKGLGDIPDGVLDVNREGIETQLISAAYKWLFDEDIGDDTFPEKDSDSKTPQVLTRHVFNLTARISSPYGRGCIAWDFIREYLRWLDREKAVFFSYQTGEYDDVIDMPDREHRIALDLLTKDEGSDLIVDRLADGNRFWAMMASRNQDSIRAGVNDMYFDSFNHDSKQWTVKANNDMFVFDFSLTEAPDKPVRTFPYLIDFCITENCGAGCDYCYMGCTPNERHGVYSNKARDVVHRLHSLGASEIVLTGGEPLLHPDINKILYDVYDSGFRSITMTTKSPKLLFDNLNVLSGLHGVAVSIASLEELDALIFEGGKLAGDKIRMTGYKHACRKRQLVDNSREYGRSIRVSDFSESSMSTYDCPELAIQIIPEMWDEQELQRFIDFMTKESYATLRSVFSHISIVLLGYKDMGRGAGRKVRRLTHAQLNEIFELKFMHFRNISVDSIFSETYRDILDGMGCDKLCRNTGEGLQSCFAVLNPEGEIDLYPSSMDYAKMKDAKNEA